MSKFTDTASEKMLIVAGKISNEKHMASIKNAFYTLMPVILTGAFCTLITNVVCSTTTNGISLAKVPGMAWLRSSSASVHFLKKDRKEVPFLKRIVPKRNFPKWLGCRCSTSRLLPFPAHRGPRRCRSLVMPGA